MKFGTSLTKILTEKTVKRVSALFMAAVLALSGSSIPSYADELNTVKEESGFTNTEVHHDHDHNHDNDVCLHGAYVDTVLKNPSYKDEGIKLRTCSACGYAYIDSIPKLACAHLNTKVKKTTEATCATKALGKVICKDCGEVIDTAYEMGPEDTSEHASFSETITKEPTASEEGIKTFTCDACGYSYTESIPKLTCEHKHTEFQQTVAATCTKKARGNLVCLDCGEIINANYASGKIDRSAHVHFTESVIKPATYKADGLSTFTCDACGYSYTEKTDRLICNHEETEYVQVTAATCTTKARGRLVCKICEDVLDEDCEYGETDPDNHVNATIRVIKEATCIAEGEREITCHDCGVTKTEATPKSDKHDTSGSYEIESVSTCQVNGLMVKRCPLCNEIVDTLSLSLEPHKYVWEVKVAATLTTEGLKEYKCKWCGLVNKTEVIPKDLSACTHPEECRVFTETKAPTCAHRAIGKLTCNKCGQVIDDNYESEEGSFDPDNHDLLCRTTREASYQSTGVKTYSCKNCDYKYTEEIPKLICNHCTIIVKKYQEEYWKYCSDCGEYIEKIETSVDCNHTGYAKQEVVVKEATSTEWGKVKMVCSNCGATREEYSIHPYVSYEVTKGNGQTETVYGWFDDDWALEIMELTNEYRLENGLNTLSYNYSLQWASNKRAAEAAVKWDHERPDGTRWNTVCSQWTYGGENLASGHKSPLYAMVGWKNSPGHNANLLYGIETGQTRFKALSVGVFHQYKFTDANKPHVPVEKIYWSQQFTFYEYH